MENSGKSFISFKLHPFPSSVIKSHVILLPNHQHELLLTSNHPHYHGLMTQDHPKQMILLLTYRRLVVAWFCVTMHMSFPHFISPCTHFIVSHHHKKREYNKIFGVKKKRDHIYVTFIIAQCCNLFCFIIVVVNLLLCLIHKLNFITSLYVCIERNIVCIVSGTTSVSIIHRGALGHIPHE